MVVYTLHYFKKQAGRVELARLLLVYGRIPFEEVLIDQEVEWLQLKSNYPNGQLPILEVDGEILTQSTAIARYFAKKLNLLGDDDFEAAQADAFVDSIDDTYATLVPNGLIIKIVRGKGAEVASEAVDALRPFLERLEKHLLTTNGENLVGNHLTWADFALADLYKRYSVAIPILLLGFPEVKKFVERVLNLPQVKEYVETRKIEHF